MRLALCDAYVSTARETESGRPKWSKALRKLTESVYQSLRAAYYAIARWLMNKASLVGLRGDEKQTKASQPPAGPRERSATGGKNLVFLS